MFADCGIGPNTASILVFALAWIVSRSFQPPSRCIARTQFIAEERQKDTVEALPENKLESVGRTAAYKVTKERQEFVLGKRRYQADNRNVGPIVSAPSFGFFLTRMAGIFIGPDFEPASRRRAAYIRRSCFRFFLFLTRNKAL